MSWGFGGVAANSPQSAVQTANAAPDLEAIETEQLGFQALDGERKVRLFGSPWPSDALPSKTASLLAVANERRLLAAAGPDSLILYDTDAIRSAFKESGKEKLVQATARTTISIPRLSHLAFTSDENALVIAAETGGGLAIYDVSAANVGATWSPSYQISTEGTAVRHLLPNPNAEASHLLAVVLVDGKLLLADLKSKSFISGSSGSTVLKDNVSCASWSKKGKQIVVGLADGTAVQLDTQGSVKGSVPRPPSIPVDQQLPVTAISWLENLGFLLVHSPVAGPGSDADGMASMSETFFHLALRDKDTKVCSYHRFVVDPCPAFMDDRLPAHHYIQRIREWQPNLDDSLIIACTASTDIGVLTRSKKPLSQDLPAEQITHTYTTTSFTDTRRAALPIATNDIDDTFPIGMVMDLSSQQKVAKPIPNDETIDESDTPLPELCVLNQEGVLSAWWYVYNEAVRGKQAAPGMSTSARTPTPQQQSIPSISASTGFGGVQTPAKPAFGQPSTPQFGQSSASAFGKPSFGSTSTPGFGAPSGLGLSPAGSAFGQSANLSFGKPSVWGNGGQAATASQAGSSFGQPSQPFGGTKAADNPFAAFAKQHRESQSNTAASPFAGFAQSNSGASPFASFNTQSSKLSPFATQSKGGNESPFATQAKPGMPNETSFGSTVTLNSNSGSFGSSSTFAPSRFGQPSELPEAPMQDNSTPREEKKEQSAFGSLGGFKLGSTFKPDGTASTDLPASKGVEKSLFGSSFGDLLSNSSSQEAKPVIKEEATDSQQVNLHDIPEAPSTTIAKTEPLPEPAPLPPDFTSTKTKSPNAEDAPLPPDFVSKPKAEERKSETSGNDIPLPPDFLATKASTSAETKTSTAASELPIPPAQASPEPGSEEDDSDPQDWDGVSEGDDDDGDEEEEEEDDDDDEDAEGEWEEEEEDEEAADDDDEDRTPRIVDPARLSAFTSRITHASPEATKPEKESTTPETVQKPSFTPAGFPKASVNFAPPRTVQESPRSPSPVRTDRAVTSPVRFPPQESSFQPTAMQQAVVPNAQLKASTGNARASLFQSKPPPQSVEALEDEDDVRMQQILKAPIRPSRTLPDFIAHQDYTGSSNKEGIPGQLEKVYRDVNSMIDTIGLNARALKAFVEGHSPTSKDKDLSRDNLEHAEAWAIGDVYALEMYQVDIDEQVEKGKLTDISDKVDEILEQDEQLARLNAKAAEVRKQISLRTDPQKRAQQQAAALPSETAAQQTELRRSVQNVQRLLAQVEEEIILLRAALASTSAASTDANGATVRPSVENVTRVIEGLTAQIERKSGDVDLLEAQIKRLPGGIRALGMSASYEDGLIDSLAGSRLSNGQTTYSTSPRRRQGAKADALGMSGMLGSRLQASISSLRQSTSFDPTGSMLGRSTASLPGSARKKIADVTSEEVEVWKTKASQRRHVLQSLRRVVEESGAPRVVIPNQGDA